MTDTDESLAQKRNRLHHDFLGLAGRVERLLSTDPDKTALDRSKLVRWQNLYTAPEGALVLKRREGILHPGAAPSIATLEDWNDHIRKLLKDAPDNPTP